MIQRIEAGNYSKHPSSSHNIKNLCNYKKDSSKVWPLDREKNHVNIRKKSSGNYKLITHVIITVYYFYTPTILSRIKTGNLREYCSLSDCNIKICTVLLWGFSSGWNSFRTFLCIKFCGIIRNTASRNSSTYIPRVPRCLSPRQHIYL